MPGRAARSWTKSKSSSRGAEMVVWTVTSRTAADSMRQAGRSGGPGHHGQATRARVHAFGAHRGAPLLGQGPEAELAEQAAGIDLEQALARQRGAPALIAVVTSAANG